MALKNIKEIKRCPECASTNIIHNEKKQQVICRDCGLIFEPLMPEFEEKYEKIAGINPAKAGKAKPKKIVKKKR
jgi:transcription initiation factor TFIIIB Brf1 subunit/transcription initiation factor TFIIB